MARHSRQGAGEDQRGFAYDIAYAPDWLDHIRVTRLLPSGRQSTKTLLRNPARSPRSEPGRVAKTLIRSPAQGLAVEVAVATRGAVRAVKVHWSKPDSLQPALDRVSFTLKPFAASR